ncbi:NAD(P)H-binding protein [Streptomyces scopuliridis]|uniref:NAD(P)H-binding protein n=1 Tax=Streptomyces scopuliridis TaxID=452529 RepID=A0ACD4ZIW6_9ACTN|nr:NAD(P)H-binding protein [Streptomyces scopuliridis]WSB98134.1 NAD(P)H-binding protein [Streptomyces scopuliridis]WSC08164.1 NAD(P)H-binding protein [Streptomyces scopuliridis]
MIVVTGATGNVGQALVELLAGAGERVTAVSRRAPESGVLPAGVVHRAADLADADGLAPALEGADALFLLVAGEDPEAILSAAKAGGVRRVVLLSSQGAGTRPDAYRHPVAFETAVKGSGLEWTVLRPGGFATNTFQWAQSVREQRTVVAPFADVALPAIDPADIAAVAAVVLREDGHGGRTYELTGPAALSPRRRAEVIAEALGEPVRFVEQTPEEARAQLLGFMPEPVVAATLAILGAPTAAEQAVSPDVEKVLGRAPRSFAEWTVRNLAAFR